MSNRTLLPRLKYLARRAQLFLSKGPGYAWVFLHWQANRWARQAGLRRRPWLIDESGFWAQLDLDRPLLSEVTAAAQSGDEASAARALLDYFRYRQQPRFFFDKSTRAALLAHIDSERRAATLAAADQVVQRTFHFRGQSVTFEGPIDWTHRPHGNTDWMWDLNRHLYFITLGQALWYSGDARYAQVFSDLLTDWLTRNPPDERQPNWTDPFEVACRINAWLWAYHLFSSAEALDAATHLNLLRGLWLHGVYLDTCLELHVPNNHLLLEAKALALLGLCLPEFRAAQRWQTRGRRILEQEVKRQVCSDGVHAERVPHYHRLIAGELLEWLVLLDNNDRAAPQQLVDRFVRMLEFERHITRPDGRIPLFGDSAHDDPHVRFNPMLGGAALLGRGDFKLPQAALDEMTLWLLGPERARRFNDLPARLPLPSRSFPAGGYVVMRNNWETSGLYLALDCGPFGYQLATGHGHADALSIEVHGHGRPLLVDSGVYSFHLGTHWRNTFRSTRAHNTVVVDGQDQSVLLDSGRAWRPAQVTLNDWATDPHFDFVDAAHDGYHRLPERITHRRRIFFVKPDYWLVADRLAGSGAHDFEALFHLPPDVHVDLDRKTGSVQASGLAIIPLRSPGMRVSLTEGWVSLRSGEKQQSSVVVHTLRAVAPAMFHTLLCPVMPTTTEAPRVSDLTSDVRNQLGNPVAQVTALSVDTTRYHDIVVLDWRSGLNPKRLGPYETDATLLYLRCQADDPTPSRIALRHGTYLALDGKPLVKTSQLSAGLELPGHAKHTEYTTQAKSHAR
ncbi:MAG TPA: alginate lyase family protein [Anaerolineae bacterium]|nr:alginate lyase family protein [Anaerolineae bacterium]